MAATLHLWDVLRVPWPIDSGSVQAIVTSPPYWGLRDYNVPGQLGLEADVGLYVDRIVTVFREARRVLRRDGTLWLNLGDTHYTAKGAYHNYGGNAMSHHADLKLAGAVPADGSPNRTMRRGRARELGLKPGDLVGVPWRVALALQADGWILRSDIVWSKPNPMPESVRTRPTRSHEYVFLISRARPYYFDADSIAEPCRTSGRLVTPSGWDTGPGSHDGMVGRYEKRPGGRPSSEFRNPRTVWEIAPEPNPDAHFATFPTELARRAIAAGSRPGDLVLDPFAGSGTTLLVADRLKREAVGLELNPAYLEMAARRLADDAPLFAAVESAPGTRQVKLF